MGFKWSEREEEMLFSLAGDVPFSSLVRTYHQWASTEKFQYRTAEALMHRLKKNGYSARSFGEWLDTRAVSQFLGISVFKVRYWITTGLIRGHREGRRWYISRTGLRDLARRRPDLFQEQEETVLIQLLCDPTLAKELSERDERLPHGKRQRIRCIETGRVYKSMAEAGRHVYVCGRAISKAMLLGKPCAGLHWEFVK